MLINIICLISLITWLFVCIKKKNIIHPISFIFLGFFVPLFLYNLGWSDLIDSSNCKEFNYLMIVFCILSIFYACFSSAIKPRKLKSNQKIKMTHIGKKIVSVLTFSWIICYLMENYLGTGYLIPAHHKIDLHTLSIPIISYFTSSSFIVTSIDYIAFKATKKKRYLLYIVICIVLPVVTRSSRMSTMISIVQLVCLMYVLRQPATSIKERRKRKLFFIMACFIIVGFISYMALLTNYRMSHYGKYDIDYASTIQYTGPDFFGIIEVYYGYFPMSFNNLKINILYNTSVNHNYYGLYSYTTLWFGLLQFDNLFGIPTDGYLTGTIFSSGSATVPTGLWEFWYDFKYFAFIPIIVAFLITYYLQKKASQEKYKLTYRVLYSWFIPFWFFTSFQNVLFQSVNIMVFVIILLLIKRCFYLIDVDLVKHKEKNKNFDCVDFQQKSIRDDNDENIYINVPFSG